MYHHGREALCTQRVQRISLTTRIPERHAARNGNSRQCPANISYFKWRHGLYGILIAFLVSFDFPFWYPWKKPSIKHPFCLLATRIRVPPSCSGALCPSLRWTACDRGAVPGSPSLPPRALSFPSSESTWGLDLVLRMARSEVRNNFASRPREPAECLKSRAQTLHRFARPLCLWAVSDGWRLGLASADKLLPDADREKTYGCTFLV